MAEVAGVGVLDPAAAMQERDYREGTPARRQAKLRELLRSRAVGDPGVGRPRRELDDVGGLGLGHSGGRDQEQGGCCQCDSAGAGISELTMSSMASHLPSPDLRKIVMYLPFSVNGCLVLGSVIVIE